MKKVYWNCFGTYSDTHPVCARYCNVRLKCMIEKEHSLQTALMEEIIFLEDDVPKSTH